jgi:hypothetical protein
MSTGLLPLINSLFWGNRYSEDNTLSRVGVPVYSEGTEAKPSQIAKNGIKEAKSKKTDVIIVDTAGRLQVILIFSLIFSSCFSYDSKRTWICFC